MNNRVNWKKHLKNIPNRVQLGHNIYYEVLWVDGFLDEKVLGETRFDPKQIVLKKGLAPKETVVTFFHEILHAVSAECEANLTENQILALEKKFYYVLKPGNILKEEN